MAAKSGNNWNFSPLHRTLLYYPVGQNLAGNCSISYGFWDIHTFSFSAKIQDGHQKWRKLKFFLFRIGHCCTTLQVKNWLEIALSLTVLEIFTLFHFPLKSNMAAKSGDNWNFSPLYRTILYYPVGQKLAQNRSISYGFWDIHTSSISIWLYSFDLEGGAQGGMRPHHKIPNPWILICCFTIPKLEDQKISQL